MTDPDIIFCKAADDEDWQRYFKFYEVINPGTEEKVMGGYYRLVQMARYLQSTAVRVHKKSSWREKVTSLMKNSVKMMK